MNYKTKEGEKTRLESDSKIAMQDREIAREKQPPDRSAKSDQSGKITTPKEGEKTR